MQTQIGRDHEDQLIYRMTRVLFNSDNKDTFIARCNLGDGLYLTFHENDMYRFVDYIKQEGYGCK
jgi:hypothetical protein